MSGENDTPKITVDDILKVKESLGERHVDFSHLRVIENEFLADDMIVVSSKMYKALKSKNPNIL